MAVSKVNFRSEVLGKATSMNIYLPDKGNSPPYSCYLSVTWLV
ncbi:Uncharacterised protein [Niallia circulans]|nr:Uncharacterised protein [Niallia circulans]